MRAAGGADRAEPLGTGRERQSDSPATPQRGTRRGLGLPQGSGAACEARQKWGVGKEGVASPLLCRGEWEAFLSLGSAVPSLFPSLGPGCVAPGSSRLVSDVPGTSLKTACVPAQQLNRDLFGFSCCSSPPGQAGLEVSGLPGEQRWGIWAHPPHCRLQFVGTGGSWHLADNVMGAGAQACSNTPNKPALQTAWPGARGFPANRLLRQRRKASQESIGTTLTQGKGSQLGAAVVCP